MEASPAARRKAEAVLPLVDMSNAQSQQRAVSEEGLPTDELLLVSSFHGHTARSGEDGLEALPNVAARPIGAMVRCSLHCAQKAFLACLLARSLACAAFANFSFAFHLSRAGARSRAREERAARCDG